MKVGIGCITYNRPDHLRWWVKQVQENTDVDATCHIANDNKERKGIAFRSNECIKELYNAGCTHFFLFNDDCAPIKKGWEKFFIEASEASGQHHFCYLHETPGVSKISMVGYGDGWGNKFIVEYNNCNGCMLFFTREVVAKVGGFNPNFGMYGFEHADYSNRIHRAGLTPMGKYLCPAGASDYIYSLDIDNHKPEWHKKLKHKSSMPSTEALFHVRKNEEVYKRSHQIFYPL